jgi:hypothetical protein
MPKKLTAFSSLDCAGMSLKFRTFPINFTVHECIQ